ncbi:MAG: TatD family hydrolase [Caulobacteraceae bacterium]|nr:TatD family hydrolase [Caulobacteraceae bacterium]
MIIDSHVNLHHPDFDPDREAVIQRARDAGVRIMVEISDKVSTFDQTHRLAQGHPDIWCTVGTHPHYSIENPALTATDLLELADQPRVVGIGECGLDFHYDWSPRDIQAAVFRTHCEAARESRLPLVVHTREADDVMAGILAEELRKGPFKFLMHCYTSGPELARICAEFGGWFSVSGIATFKAADDVRRIISDMPGDRIIVETDCPYLAPVPLRGRRNEPAFVAHVLDKLAELRGWSREDAEHRTEDAFFRLFDRIPRP